MGAAGGTLLFVFAVLGRVLGFAAVEALGENVDIARIIRDQAAILLMRADDDGPAVLAVRLGCICGERRAERRGDGYPALVVDKADTVSLIATPYRHAKTLRTGAHASPLRKAAIATFRPRFQRTMKMPLY